MKPKLWIFVACSSSFSMDAKRRQRCRQATIREFCVSKGNEPMALKRNL